jgi:hypothetical protein
MSTDLVPEDQIVECPIGLALVALTYQIMRFRVPHMLSNMVAHMDTMGVTLFFPTLVLECTM